MGLLLEKERKKTRRIKTGQGTRTYISAYKMCVTTLKTGLTRWMIHSFFDKSPRRYRVGQQYIEKWSDSSPMNAKKPVIENRLFLTI
jgi:hypothetical protein